VTPRRTDARSANDLWAAVRRLLNISLSKLGYFGYGHDEGSRKSKRSYLNAEPD